MQPTAHRLIAVEEYLEGELRRDVKHEYIGGDVDAMAGASVPDHSIALNRAFALRRHLGSGRCKVFMSDVKLRLKIQRTDIFYYPDVHAGVAFTPRA